MLEIIKRKTKNCLVFTVLDNRINEVLLSLVINNIYTYNDLSDYNSKEEISLYPFTKNVYLD